MRLLTLVVCVLQTVLRKHMQKEHLCLDGEVSFEPSWWERDAKRIPLCRVCRLCRKEKLAKYRPEILTGYDQNDVDEPIEPE